MCTRENHLGFNSLDALETAKMVILNVSNLGVISIYSFNKNNYVGVFSISLSLALIVLDSYLVYTPMYWD